MEGPRRIPGYNDGMAERSKRRWYQFTVGGLLVLTTFVSLPLGWFTYQRNKALKEQQADDRFHKLIRDATKIVQPQASGKPWKEVQTLFAETGYELLSEDQRQYTVERRFLMREEAWGAMDGTQHRLIVDVSVPAYEETKRVVKVAAGLTGSPNTPFEEAVRDELFPKRSAVGVCLADSGVVEAAKDYPILKEITVTYDLIRDKWNWSDTYSYGFHVSVELGKSAANDLAGRRMYFTVDSSLDPPEDRNGRPMTEGFEPSSALGEVHQWGSSQWESFATP